MWGCVMLYKVRNVRAEFNETKWVSFAMVSSLQVLLLGIPLLVAMGDDANTRFFVTSAIIFLNDISVLVCIFAPKMFAIAFPAEDEKKGVNEATAATVSGQTSSNDDADAGMINILREKINKLEEENATLKTGLKAVVNV